MFLYNFNITHKFCFGLSIAFKILLAVSAHSMISLDTLWLQITSLTSQTLLLLSIINVGGLKPPQQLLVVKSLSGMLQTLTIDHNVLWQSKAINNLPRSSQKVVGLLG